MVPDTADLARARQLMLQMPFPTRGVLAGAITAKFGPVDDHLQPPADAPGGLVPRLPNRLEDLEHDIGVVHRLHRQRADLGKDVSLEMNDPLLRIGCGPAALFAVDKSKRGLAEGHRRLRCGNRPPTAAMVDRIDTLLDQLAVLAGTLARFV